MKQKIAVTVAALLLGSTPWLMAASTKKTAIEDSSLGLAKVSVEAESGLAEQPFAYQGKAPGDKNKRIARAYDNAPPMIPHDISGLPIITQSENACIQCHAPEVAKSVGAIAYPKTHMTNFRNGEDLKGELYQGRWNCTQCHAPQAQLNPVVANKFRGAFRKRIGGKYKTNLIDTMNDGVVEDKSGIFDPDKDMNENK